MNGLRSRFVLVWGALGLLWSAGANVSAQCVPALDLEGSVQGGRHLGRLEPGPGVQR